VEASDRSAECAPVAALLYQPECLPSIDVLNAAAKDGGGFAVSHAPEPSEGWAEVLREGLTFDVRGLREGTVASASDLTTALGLPIASIKALSWLAIAPGPHLAGAERLLPVIRVVSALLVELARIGPATAIAWIPARLVLKTEYFEQAIRPWLEGGPFPAPAFVAMHREADGSLRTEGLNFLTGQEFTLRTRTASSDAPLARIAVRLVDWLVAYGPVTQSAEAILAGTGAVVLEAEGSDRIVAWCD
jgi:hypothetical protein